MDGGCVLFSSHLAELRIRLMSGKHIRFFNINDPKTVPIPWYFGDAAFGKRRISAHEVPWIVLQDLADDATLSAVGLPVPIWRRLWDDLIVEIEKCVDGEWVEIDEQDWGKLDARKT